MILVAATLEGIRTRKDKTLSLSFGTQEMPPSEAGNLMALANSFCFLAIKSETFTATEKELMEQIKADQLTNAAKTPSQRLRGVLYVLFTHDDEGYTNFDKFYTFKMDQIIEHFKSKLP